MQGLRLQLRFTSSLNAGLLFWTIRRDKHYHPGKGWKIFWLRLVFANVVLLLFLWFATADLAVWFGWSSLVRVWHLAILCVGAVLLYFLCLWLSGMRLREFIFAEAEDRQK